MKRKINIIIGAPLTGKTQFIKSNFSDSEKYFHLDFSKAFWELFNSYEDATDKKLCDTRNKITEDLFDYFYFGNQEIVFEFCIGLEETDEKLKELIEIIKLRNIEVNIIQLECSVEEAQKRNELVKSDSKYYSSYHLNDELLLILPNFINDLALNDELK